MKLLKMLDYPLVMDEDDLDYYEDDLRIKCGIKIDVNRIWGTSWFVAGIAFVLSIPLLVLINRVIKIPFVLDMLLAFIIAFGAQAVYQYINYILIPSREYEAQLKKEQEEKARKEKEEAEAKKHTPEAKMETAMRDMGYYDTYKLLKREVFPEYIQFEINKLLSSIEMFMKVVDNPEEQKSFFSLHLPQILQAVKNPNLSEKDKELAKKVINQAIDYIDMQRLIFIQTDNLDDVSVLKAYNSFFGGKFQ